MHIPVLLKEILAFFAQQKISVFFDGTLGLAGHAEAILTAHPEIELYLGCDQDKEALELAKKKLAPWKDKVEFIHGNFSHIAEYLKKKKIPCVDGCLFDVGMSSFQIETEARGFSFMKEGPLDMRMDQTLPLTAAEVINKYSEKKLGEIFRDLGEEPRWRAAAKAVVQARSKKRIHTTTELAGILKEAVKGKKHLHPATLVFQALRIYVNDELNVLQKGVKSAIESLCPQGVIGVISFHRLEDRIVKNIFKENASSTLTLLTKKPLIPSNQEVKANPRSRSAKLRMAKKTFPEGKKEGKRGKG